MTSRLYIIGFLAALAATVFVATLIHAAIIPTTDTEIEAAAEPLPRSAPSRVLIPSIGVDAPVDDVGIAASGNMAVPRSYTGTGWYRGGPTPGEKGSAVIDGHVDNGLSLPGVFKDLHLLTKGDLIYIEADDGIRRTFRVEEVASYTYDAVPRERLFLRDDAPRLNLITCTGTWSQDDKTYEERLVVYAVLISDDAS